MNFSEFIDTIANDDQYNIMKNKLESLKNKINSSELSNFKKIELCENALKLAYQICEYSKNKGYDSLSKQFLGSNTDDLELNNIRELLEHTKVYTLYNSGYSLEKSNSLELALEKYHEILNNYIPKGSIYYERPAILLEKLKRYDEAIKTCDLAIKNQQEHKLHFSSDNFKDRKNRLINKLKKNCQLTNKIKRQPKKTVKDVAIFSQCNTPKSQSHIKFPDWYVSISFGKSTSKNFAQAVSLAKMAPQYIENNVEGKIIYQSIYSENPNEYLQFIKLYELINKWKSCFVVINGQIVDRKIIGGLNYCYGDKCRSGNPDFCYGASYMTDNPFGCHRVQISRYNTPWWSFGIFDTFGIWHVDKEAILRRIIEYSQPYRLCPCFSLDKVKKALEQLPNTINPQTNENWKKTGNNISPSADNIYSPSTLTYEIKINIDTNYTNKNNNLLTRASSPNTNDAIDTTYEDASNSNDANITSVSSSDTNVSINNKSGCLTTTIIIILTILFLKCIL